MKKRHLILGLTAVLTLSLVIPALGGPLQLRGTASLRSLVKKAVQTTTSAEGAAAFAQGAAAAAQRAAGGAQEGAVAAKAAVTGAQGAAAHAQATAEAARKTAGNAQAKATQTAGKIPTAESAARNILAAAEQRLGRAVREPVAQGHSVGGGYMAAEADCPPGTFIAGGGFTLGDAPGFANIDEPEGNGWEVEATTDSGSLTVRAICVER